MGFRVYGLGFRVLRFRVWDFGVSGFVLQYRFSSMLRYRDDRVAHALPKWARDLHSLGGLQQLVQGCCGVLQPSWDIRNIS